MSTENLFDVAYSEAYYSGTGRQIQDDSSSLTEFTDQYLSRPRLQYSGLDKMASKNEIALFRHPFGDALIEDDLRQMARIAFLGRALLDQAKVSLEQNTRWNSCNSSVDFVNRACEVFQSFEWAKAHNFLKDDDYDTDPDSPSPLRLQDWPNGGYLNCLGISIALAAAAELEGEDYLFANELRTSDDLIQAQHFTVIDGVRRITPDFFVPGGDWDILCGYADRFLLNHGSYRGLLFSDDGKLINGRDDDLRDWHHYITVRRQFTDTGDGYLYQVDPYGLTADFVYVDSNGIVDDFITSGHPEDALIIDSSDTYIEAYRHTHNALKKIADLVKRNREIEGRRSLEQITDGVEEVCNELLVDLLLPNDPNEPFKKDDSKFESYVRDIRKLVEEAYWYYLVEKATTREFAHKLLGLSIAPEDEFERKKFRQLTAQADQAVTNYLKYGSDQKQRREVANTLPLVVFTRVYVDTLKQSWHIKEFGSAHAAMELADPELMIGAMYLNHYATHRKDGRINVARHLVRLTSSQLVWQASQLDGECSDDPSQAAVGELVAQLPERQQHPRVALTVQTTN